MHAVLIGTRALVSPAHVRVELQRVAADSAKVSAMQCVA